MNRRPSGSGWDQREVFLITWSQANIALLDIEGDDDPRRTFGLLVASLFETLVAGFTTPLLAEEGGAVPKLVERWISCIEAHKTDGEHFHCVIKLRRRVRAKSVWKSLFDSGIKTNFSKNPPSGGYFGAYRYVRKFDENCQLSDGHPVVPLQKRSSSEAHAAAASPAGAFAAAISVDENIAGPSDENTKGDAIPPKKQRRLTAGEMREIIVGNDLDNDLKLCAFAKRMETEGMPEVIRWIDSHPREQFRVETIKTAFKLHTAEEQLAKESSIKVPIYMQKNCIIHLIGLWPLYDLLNITFIFDNLLTIQYYYHCIGFINKTKA